jgi:hypothetical protein
MSELKLRPPKKLLMGQLRMAETNSESIKFRIILPPSGAEDCRAVSGNGVNQELAGGTSRSPLRLVRRQILSYEGMSVWRANERSKSKIAVDSIGAPA